MLKVVVIGAGFYGLIAAKTYLQVTGAYAKTEKDKESDDDLLILDSASDIGGTWAHERLYPNLVSQNSYGHYEFSDLPLTAAVPDDLSEADNNQFIPGWKINQYLHVWCHKWDLSRRIRLKWTVTRISRLQSKKWSLDIVTQTGASSTSLTLVCDKLILATGLTSEPNIPEIPSSGDNPVPAIHARDLGAYCREKLGYRPIPHPREKVKSESKNIPIPRSVVVYGGAKSAFDFVHLFGSLHRNSTLFGLEAQSTEPVQVHWIIREDGHGPAWMVEPTTQLGTKEIPSDQVACTRIMKVISPCENEIPKRIKWSGFSFPRLEGSWGRRLLHGNPLGRSLIRWMWKRVDDSINAFAQYGSQPKMKKLRPATSAIECTSPGGIANHPGLWETIRGPNIHIYRSSIRHISTVLPDPSIHLTDGTFIPSVDLIVHATGWKLLTPTQFDPPELCAHLGLPCPKAYTSNYDWDSAERKVECRMRSIFHPSVFKESSAPTPSAYRLFRRVVPPGLVAEGDRSFVVMGAVYIGAVAAIAEVQALWAVAFLTGGLDGEAGPLANEEGVYEDVVEDVVWSRLTKVGLNVDTMKYNDMLMRDLGLNPYREGGKWWKELMAVYGPSSYAGIVEEWMELKGQERVRAAVATA
ncbi:hypothetical protein BJY04DRAFT_230090 [Aspergillus karnatakaensis]|uniref:uncharacterized protein n=1 Tax=Aspergillus karnatakaensis TaxID=1810916 RepID=UPI003CCCBEF3